MAMAERPDGYAPVLAHSIESKQHLVSDSIKSTYTRLEMERLSKRFGNDIGITAMQPEPAPSAEPSVTFKEFICERCHTLSNYGRGANLDTVPEAPKLDIRPDDWRLLEESITSKTLLVKIVDLIDVPYSLNPHVYDLLPHKHVLPTLLVGNKIDLLPGHGKSTVEHASNCLGKLTTEMNVIGTHLVSAKSGFGMDSLQKAILRYAWEAKQNVLLMGRTNVGKSVVYNSFCSKQVDKHHVKSTVSSAHGTTIGVLKRKLSNVQGPWKIPKNLFLFDIPGFHLPDRHLGNCYFTTDELDSACIKTRIMPIKHTLKRHKVGFIGGFCRIEADSAEDLPFQLFMQSSLPYHKKSVSLAAELFDQYQGVVKPVPPNMTPPVFTFSDNRKTLHPMELACEYTIEPSEHGNEVAVDAVFGGGLGWIAFGQPATERVNIRIYTPSGLGVRIRETPMRPNFLS